MTIDLKKEDIVISEFLNSIGVWSDSIVIGGGYAPIIYKLYFAQPNLKTFPIGTRDIDSLISRKVRKGSRRDLAECLRDAGFRKFYRDYDQPATEAYSKEIQGVEIEIEFLTDNATRANKNKNVLIAGIVAQPLSYLSLSLQMKLEFTTHSSEKGFVVTPGTWIFHKGLTFPKRKSALKAQKDLYGIWYVATQLGDFSDKAIQEVKLLERSHNSWFKTFQENLTIWLKNAAPVDWTRLEAQDPFGYLKRSQFERTIGKLTQE